MTSPRGPGRGRGALRHCPVALRGKLLQGLGLGGWAGRLRRYRCELSEARTKAEAGTAGSLWSQTDLDLSSAWEQLLNLFEPQFPLYKWIIIIPGCFWGLNEMIYSKHLAAVPGNTLKIYSWDSAKPDRFFLAQGLCRQ